MNNQNTPQKPNALLSAIYDFAELFVIAICVVIIFFTFGARLCKVDGDSMYSTLHDNEMLLVSDFAYTPKQGDIVVFHQTHKYDGRLNEPIVKRVIATEGQYVLLDWDAVYVSDDDIIDESDRVDESGYAYIEGGTMNIYPNSIGKVFQVPEGHVFVMGDNRNNSSDSRHAAIGFVDERRILGKVILRLPVSK